MSEGAPAIDRLEPSRRLVWLALAPLPLAVAAPWLPPAGPVAVALAALVLLAAALEAALLRRAALPQLSRSLPPALSIGEWAEERIELRATGPGLSLGLAADRPEGIEREDGALRLTLDEGAHVALPVRLRPIRRGPLQLAHLDLAVDGRLGLLRVRQGSRQELDAVRLRAGRRDDELRDLRHAPRLAGPCDSAGQAHQPRRVGHAAVALVERHDALVERLDGHWVFADAFQAPEALSAPMRVAARLHPGRGADDRLDLAGAREGVSVV